MPVKKVKAKEVEVVNIELKQREVKEIYALLEQEFRELKDIGADKETLAKVRVTKVKFAIALSQFKK